jgi:hypothetical protein
MSSHESLPTPIELPVLPTEVVQLATYYTAIHQEAENTSCGMRPDYEPGSSPDQLAEVIVRNLRDTLGDAGASLFVRMAFAHSKATNSELYWPQITDQERAANAQTEAEKRDCLLKQI